MEFLTISTVVTTVAFLIFSLLVKRSLTNNMHGFSGKMTKSFKEESGTYTFETSKVRFYVSICLSVLLTFSALYIILSQNFKDPDTKWAYGIVGSMIGYWMKS